LKPTGRRFDLQARSTVRPSALAGDRYELGAGFNELDSKLVTGKPDESNEISSHRLYESRGGRFIPWKVNWTWDAFPFRKIAWGWCRMRRIYPGTIVPFMRWN